MCLPNTSFNELDILDALQIEIKGLKERNKSMRFENEELRNGYQDVEKENPMSQRTEK